MSRSPAALRDLEPSRFFTGRVRAGDGGGGAGAGVTGMLMPRTERERAGVVCDVSRETLFDGGAAEGRAGAAEGRAGCLLFPCAAADVRPRHAICVSRVEKPNHVSLSHKQTSKS